MCVCVCGWPKHLVHVCLHVCMYVCMYICAYVDLVLEPSHWISWKNMRRKSCFSLSIQLRKNILSLSEPPGGLWAEDDDVCVCVCVPLYACLWILSWDQGLGLAKFPAVPNTTKPSLSSFPQNICTRLPISYESVQMFCWELRRNQYINIYGNP